MRLPAAAVVLVGALAAVPLLAQDSGAGREERPAPRATSAERHSAPAPSSVRHFRVRMSEEWQVKLRVEHTLFTHRESLALARWWEGRLRLEGYREQVPRRITTAPLGPWLERRPKQETRYGLLLRLAW